MFDTFDNALAFLLKDWGNATFEEYQAHISDLYGREGRNRILSCQYIRSADTRLWSYVRDWGSKNYYRSVRDWPVPDGTQFADKVRVF